MTALLFLACELTTPPPPPPPPVEEVKPRVSLRSLTSAEGSDDPNVDGLGEPQEEEAPAGCGVDIDLSKVSVDETWKEQGLTGTWGRVFSEPLIMRDPSRGCPILVPGKLVVEVPQDLGCSSATISVNVGCSGPCAHAKSLQGGQTVGTWENGLEKSAEVALKGPMDSIEIWSDGLELCRIRLD